MWVGRRRPAHTEGGEAVLKGHARRKYCHGSQGERALKKEGAVQGFQCHREGTAGPSCSICCSGIRRFK